MLWNQKKVYLLRINDQEVRILFEGCANEGEKMYLPCYCWDGYRKICDDFSREGYTVIHT